MILKSFEVSLMKGRYGEEIVRRYLEAKGYVVYNPVTDGAHAFDILAIKDKSKCIAIDVKAKSRRTKYPDTGINQKHLECYELFSKTHNMQFWLFFVDEFLGTIYGNTLSELSEIRMENGIKYPLYWQSHNGGADIVYWPLSAMKTVHVLTDKEKRELADLSQRNYDYEEAQEKENQLWFLGI